MSTHVNSPQASPFHTRHAARRAATFSGCVFLFLALLLFTPSFALAAAVVEFSTATASDAENSGGNQPDLVVTGDLGSEATVDVVVTGGTAEAGDYSNTVEVTIPAGNYANDPFPTNLSINADTVVEADETIQLQLQNPTGDLSIGDANADLTTQSTHTYTITNDDAAALTITDESEAEGTDLVFTVTLDNAVEDGFTVAFAAADGTATAADDYTVVTGTPLTFTGTPSETQTITVQSTNDTKVEEDEEFTVTLGAVTPGSADAGDITTGDVGTGTIQNDDAATLTITDESEAEGTNLVFTVTLDNAVEDGFTVAFAAADGTATAADDYTVVTGTPLTFTGTPSETQTITVQSTNDTKVEADEEFTVTLGAVTPGSADAGDITTGDVGTGTITDDDTANLTITDESEPEGTDLVFTVQLTNEVDAAFDLAFTVTDGTATDADDFDVATASPITFAGTLNETHTITVQTTNDTKVEEDEQFTVVLDSVTHTGNITFGGPGTGTITDSDTAALTITDETEIEGTNVVFTVTLDNAVEDGFTVAFAAADGTATSADDYTVSTGSPLTFTGNAGEFHTISVQTTNDTKVEEDEQFTVTLGAVTPGSADAGDITTGAAGTGTITDNDAATLTITDESETEGTNVVFTVTLDRDVEDGFDVAFTVADGTATAADDYTVSTASPLTFTGTAGEIQTITVQTTNDTKVEEDEQFTVTLGAVTPVSANAGDITTGAVGTGTITNDDTATLTITDVSGAEGIVLDFTVTLDNAVQDGFDLAFTVVNGTATNWDDYTVATASPLTFTGNALEFHTISVQTTNDTKVEEDEQFTVVLGVVTPGSADSADIVSGAVGTGEITNNDTANVTITDEAAIEGGNLSFTVTLDNEVEDGFDLNFTVNDGTATLADNDFTQTTASPVHFTGGAGQTRTIAVASTNDTTVELQEDFTVTLDSHTHLAGGSITLGGPGTGLINDNDTATITINDVGVSEDAGPLTFTVSLSNPIDMAVDVYVDYTDVTATGGGVDYDSATDTVTFVAGDTMETVDVDINNDAIVEANETFTSGVSLVTGIGNRSFDDTDTGTGTITDNDFDLIMLVDPAASGCTIIHTPTGTDCGPACDSYNANTNVTLTPDPAAGYAFTHWTGALSGVSYPQTVTMNADKTVTAHFETTEDCSPVVNQKTDGTTNWHSLGHYEFSGALGEEVNMTCEGDGSISFDAIRFVRLSDSAETIVDDGDLADVTYAPSSGWATVACGDCEGLNQHETDVAGDKVTINVTGLTLNGTYDVQVKWKAASDRDESAHYCVIGYGSAIGGHPITVTKGANGTMSYTVNAGPAEDVDTGTTRFWVDTGDNVLFTFDADDAPQQYEIEYVAVDGDIVLVPVYSGKTTPQTYPFPSVAQAHEIEVSFIREEQETTETCYSVDQTQDGSNWYYLGSFMFWSGTQAKVVLSHQGDGSVSLDAIRWEPAEGGADVIIDDDDPECVYDESGSTDWAVQDCSGCYDGYHHYTDAEGDQVTVTPDLPEAGVYNIYIQWHANPYRDTTASVCVYGHRGQVILAEAGPNGVMIDESGVTVESGTTKVFTVISGTTKTFTAYSDEGYKIDQILVDGEVVTDSGVTEVFEYIFSNLLSSHTITALFEDHGYDCTSATPITCGSAVSGMVSPIGDVDYFEVDLAGSGRYTFYTTGDTDTLGTLLDTYCTPITTDDESGGDSNFAILANLDAGTYYVSVESASGTTGEYSMNMTCEHVVRASAGAGGNIDPAGNIIVPHNSGTTFTITPDSGVSVEDVLVDGASVGAVSTYSFSNLTENHTIEAFFTFEPTTCTDISDVPLDALTAGVGAIVMFVLDDSGSMDWEYMTEEGDGLFMNEDYVFNNPGDNLYSDTAILSGDDRGRWKSQWNGYNHIYYNPKTTYETWPTLPNADPDDPRSHPYHATPTFNMDTTYYSVALGYVVNNDGVAAAGFINDDGTGGEYTCTTDAWYLSSGANWYGNDTTRSVYTTQSGATASWCPNLPANGEYEVFVWYTDSGDRDPDAPYMVVHDGGVDYGIRSDNYTVNQNDTPGTWVSIGTYDFTVGGYAYGPSGVTIIRYNDGSPVLGADGATPIPATPSGDDWDDHYDYTCADAVAFVPTGAGTINIPRSHYYTLYDLDGDGEQDANETVYLVCLNGATSSIDYYEADVSDDHIAAGDLTPVDVSLVPEDVRPKNPNGSYRTYAEARQNFANWYSYYRRRELTALAAISRTIYDLEGVYVGFTSINGKIKQPILPINIDGEDRRSDLLTTLYEYVGSAYGTPLRRGFEDAGEYLHQNDGGENGGISSDSPWRAEGDGGECQQAFCIVMTDGYYNGGSPYVGNVDGNNGAPYADGYSETLGDVAMKYYENDLVSGVTDMVPTNAFDDAEYQHMVTYTVSFGVSGTLNPDDYDVSAGSTNYPTWPNPYSSNQCRIDDMWHAAVNGRGEYLSAGDPDELVESLKDIMESIAARTGSAASVSINGDQLFGILGEDVRIFQARYSSGTMTGDVLSFELDQSTGEVLLDTPVWSAADELDDRVDLYGHEDRVIATYSLAAGVGGIPFRYNNILASGTTTQLDDLTPDWSASAAATPENLVNYLRGEQTYELENSGPFRDRSSRLGDIVNSSPTYHGNMLYAGGNDGMLHAFDAETGREVFAYVPGLVYDHIKDYADPDYAHLFYVDKTPYVEEGVEISGVEKTVLLGGLGKGGKGYYAIDITGVTGAQSFVGTTESDLADRVLWEYPNPTTPASEIADMGYTFSRAYVYGSNDKTNAPWIVVFGNGYNSENSSAVLFVVNVETGTLVKRIDTGDANCNGLSSPALFDSDFDGDVDYIYAGDLRGNLWKFDLTSSDYNDWGVAYGVDNAGFTAINADEGDDPAPLFRAQGPGGSLQPITVEPDFMYHCDPRKPGMMVIFGTGKYIGEDDIADTSVQSVYGIWDYGDDSEDDEYLGSFDRGFVPQLSNQPNSVTLLEQIAVDYVMDVLVDSNGNGILESGVDEVEEMTLRVLSANTPYWQVTTTPDGTACGNYPSSESQCDPECASGCEADVLAHAGWYVDLPLPGERVIGNPIIRLGVLNYISFTPEDSPCGGEGDSFANFADPCDGGNLGGEFIDINLDGIINEQDLINIGTTADPIWVAPSAKQFEGRLQPPAIVRMPGAYGESRDRYFFSSSLGTIPGQTTKSPKMGIIYWKDLLN